MFIYSLGRTAFAMASISSSRSQEWQPPATAAVPLSGLVPSNGRRPGRGFLQIAAVKSMEAVESPSLRPRGIRMRSFYELELKVRDYELDQFGVVNNAVYPRYCQHAFHELMERIGLSVDEVARRGKALAIRESSMKFIAPLRSGDKFVVKVRFCSSTVTSLIVECILFKVQNQERVLESKATVIWLDKSYRPVRIPSEMISEVLKFDTYNLVN